MIYQAARDKARELLKSGHWDGTFPVQLTPFTEALGARVFRSQMKPDISGLVVKLKSGAASVVLNQDEPSTRQRFTWAHELGHIIERSTIADDSDYSFIEKRSREYDAHEFFADEFAGALLIPARELRRLEALNCSDAQIAQHFGVSIPAIAKRRVRLQRHPDEE